MTKIKDSIKKITPFVKPYRIGFLTAILLIIVAAVFTALAPRVEGLIITQLTNDSFDLIKRCRRGKCKFQIYYRSFNFIACSILRKFISNLWS
mgnify:CR=1 FL=1